VHLYREAHFAGSMAALYAYLDDTLLAQIDNGRYASVRVPAGLHALRWVDPRRKEKPDDSVRQVWDSGKTYYVQIGWSPHIRLVSVAEARAEIAKLKLLDASRVFDASVVLEPLR
jgi:hypothetical protein